MVVTTTTTATVTSIVTSTATVMKSTLKTRPISSVMNAVHCLKIMMMLCFHQIQS